MSFRIISLFFSILAFYSVSSKTFNKDSLKTKKRPAYMTIGAGFHTSTFRDFATSPLFYKGFGPSASIGSLRQNAFVDSEFTFQFSNGNYFSIVNNEVSIATFNQSSFNYGYLLQIQRLKTDKWDVKAGATLSAFFNVRNNESLFNNSFGFESFHTLSLSAKVTREISRQKLKIKKLLFLKLKFKPKKRDISFRINVGVLNSNLRNGYAYLNQSWLLSDDSQVLDDYKFNFMTGMRLATEFNYTRYLTNGNAFRISYQSNVYHTGKDQDRFEAAHHNLKLILLFKTK